MNNSLKAKKSLGQHWLDDNASLHAMCHAAGVRAGDTVLEIGPGHGSLTASLLEQGASVVAVELDKRLGLGLRNKFKTESFKLNLLSILDFDFNELPKDYKIVANIPYYLTNHLLRRLTEVPNKPLIAVLLVQKEVAKRVTAKPGEMSALSVVVQLFFDATTGRIVSADLFKPAPKIDSQILILKQREQTLLAVETKKFMKLVQAGFGERRKKLRSSLSGGMGFTKTQTEQLLNQASIDPNRRAQNLSLQEWYKLYISIYSPAPNT